MSTEFTNFSIESQTGAKLNCYRSDAAVQAKGVVQISHGMAEHAARYERFAGALNESGYHVIAHDHRGHGATTAPDASLGYFAASGGADKVIADLKAVNDQAKEIWPGLPVFYFGHSMGSIIGLAYAIRHSDSIAGSALWNSGVDTGFLMTVFRLLLKSERFFKGSDTPSAIAQKLTFDDWNRKFAPNRTEFDWLSRIDAEVDSYVADPLCGFPCSSGLWLDVTGLILEGASDANLKRIRKDLPMFLLGGESDPCSDFGKAMQRLANRLKARGISNVRVEILPNNRHETLNDLDRDAAIANYVNWLDQRV